MYSLGAAYVFELLTYANISYYIKTTFWPNMSDCHCMTLYVLQFDFLDCKPGVWYLKNPNIHEPRLADQLWKFSIQTVGLWFLWKKSTAACVNDKLYGDLCPSSPSWYCSLCSHFDWFMLTFLILLYFNMGNCHP